MEGSSLGLVVRGDLSREKYSEGESPGENFPGGNYSEVIVHWPKFQRLIVLGGGGFHQGNYLGDCCLGGNYSGVIVWGTKV